MNELIRKQTVLNMIDDVQFGNITNKLSQLHEAVKNLPSVDAVEVVRCKDCINSDWYKTIDGKYLCYCMEHGNHGHKETDFCSYGINKTVLENATEEGSDVDG